MVEVGITEVHVVQAVGGGFFDDGAGFGVVDARRRDVDVRVGDVRVAGEERWDLGPVEQIRGVREAELGGDVVEGGVCDVESAVDADDAGVFGPPYGFVVFGRVDDGGVEAGEAGAVGRPS